MAYISKITPLGSNESYDLKAAMLTHTPNNTTTFLRGDNTWSNTLTGNLLLSKDANTEWANAPALQLTGADSKIASIKLTNSGTNLDIGWDWTAREGAGIGFRSTSSTDTTGGFYLFARDATEEHNLVGKTNGDLTWSGLFKITSNSNTTTIGSQNANFCHIYNSANIPFIFNNTVATTSGSLGNTSYPFANLYIGPSNGAGIYYKGTQNTYRMIRFIDNTTDNYGNGISIGGGGQTIIGGGESADTAAAQAGTAGGEIMQVCNDGNVELIANLQNGWDNRKVLTLNTSGYLMCPSYINVPTGNNENPTLSQFIVTNGSDNYYRKASAAHAMAAIRSNASGSWGISITGNAATVSRATFGDSSNAEHNCNNITSNGLWYYSSNGPATTIGASTTDGALYSQAYNTSWVAQIAQDYRNGNLFVRGKNNGTWQAWNKVLTTQDGQIRYNVGDTATNSYYLIKINPATSWMLNFTLTLYDSYIAKDIQISGYNYGSNHWYSPSAVILGSSGTGATTVYFGYTADWNLYVAVAAGNYGGAAITNYCNGYTQIEPNGLFTITKVNSLPGTIQATQTIYRPWYRGEAITGAVWNDYAEYRKDNPNENQEPGRCIRELGDGSLALTTQRLERGCEIVSDTFGFAIGQDEENSYNTPIASNGRVLAYPYESIEEFTNHIGWPVCSGPNGTVSIMTEEEEEKYPSRIIGTISEIPTYETWGTGNVKVNGRIWIRIK